VTEATAPRAGTDLAERKRQVVRDAMAEAAMGLLACHGFEATTIDDMVAAAGVSRRTFFRYFESKEDVIVHSIADHGARVHVELAARPEEESTAVALRHAVSMLIAGCHEQPAKSLALTKMIFGTPSLLGRYYERQVEWRLDLGTELGHRLGLDPDRDMRPELVAGVALAAFDTALRRWSAHDGAEDLDALTDEAFALVADILNSPG
jgi:AcrR family transcriptional regulator